MKLQVSQLREFIKYISVIKNTNMSNDLLKYIKVKKGLITKTNLSIYCSMQIDYNEEEEILIDENILKMLLNKTNAPEIEIKKLEDKTVIISDGSNFFDYITEDETLYPQLYETPNGKGSPVGKEIINTIKTARSFVSEDAAATNFRCVHFIDNFVLAITGNLFYIQQFKWKFPNVVLLDDYCDVITQFESCFFNQTSQHYFYDFGLVRYAFLKTEYPTPDVIGRYEMLKNLQANTFTIDKKELVDFCDMANGLTSTKEVYCSFEKDEKLGSVFVRKDLDYSKSCKKKIYVDGDLAKYAFNSRRSINAIKSLPQMHLKCKVASNTLIITSDNTFACFSGVAI